MGKQWKQCQTLIFGGSKITADGDFSHEIKGSLLLGRRVMTNLDSILKSRVSVGEGEGGVIWANGIETCIISHMKRIASPRSMHDTGCLGVVHWDDREGWYGDGGGRGFRMGNTCTPVADSGWYMAKPIQYCKVVTFPLK